MNMIEQLKNDFGTIGSRTPLRDMVEQKLVGGLAPDLINQLKNLVKTGEVKAGELAWSGLLEWLEDQGSRNVDAREVENWLDENHAQLEMILKTELPGTLEWSGQDLMLNGEKSVSIRQMDDKWAVIEPYISTDEDPAVLEFCSEKRDAEKYAERVARSDVSGGYIVQELEIPRYAGDQLPGGEHYKELLIKMPIDQSVDEGDAFFRTYKSPHWYEPNVIAHIRFNERQDNDGKSVLFIEEIDSDLHMEALRKEGYDSSHLNQVEWERRFREIVDARDEYVKRFMAENPGMFPETGLGYSAEKEREDEYVAYLSETDPDYRELEEIQDAFIPKEPGLVGVPDTPFKRSWAALALKTAVRYAAENGFDKVAWTTGDMQFSRSQERDKKDILHFYNKKLINETNKFFCRSEWGGAKVENSELFLDALWDAEDESWIEDEGFALTKIAVPSLRITPEMRAKASHAGLPGFGPDDRREDPENDSGPRM